MLGHHYQVSTIGPLGVCVKSPTLEVILPEQVFISGGTPHLTSRFCWVVQGPTTNSKIDIHHLLSFLIRIRRLVLILKLGSVLYGLHDCARVFIKNL